MTDAVEKCPRCGMNIYPVKNGLTGATERWCANCGYSSKSEGRDE